ncbi:hypothetical protein LCGC14_1891350, partial [marine sediment metagenome]
IILAIMSWMAAEERKKISDRTKAGIARRRAIGQWKGGRPKKKKGGYTLQPLKMVPIEKGHLMATY